VRMSWLMEEKSMRRRHEAPGGGAGVKWLGMAGTGQIR